MNKKLLTLAVCSTLAGCASPTMKQELKDNMSDGLSRSALGAAPLGVQAGDVIPGSVQAADRLAQEQVRRQVMRRSTSTFLGAQMVPATNEDRLPSIFKREFSMHYDDKKSGRFVSLQVVANRLTEKTGVPVRLHPDLSPASSSSGSAAPPPQAFSAAASSASAMVVPPILPVGVAPQPGVVATSAGSSAVFAGGFPAGPAPRPAQLGFDAGEMKWDGTLVGYLNNLTDRLGLAWEYRDNTVVIMRYVTESHEVATFQGSTEFSMSTGGNSTGSAGGTAAQNSATNQLSITETGKYDPLASIEKTVTKMVESVPGSAVIRAEGSGRLVVKTTREMQSQVRDYIKAENASMLRQAQIQFDIYSVRTDTLDENGIDWTAVFNSLSGAYGVSLSSPAPYSSLTGGAIALNILSGGTTDTSRRFGGTGGILNLLNQVGTNVQHRPVSLLALNRTWARKSRLDTEHYLAETTPGPASSTGVGAPGLKLDKVTTGDQYIALPQILDNNTVLLKFGISLSDLLALFDVQVGEGLTSQRVQAPRVQSIGDQYSVKLEPGQVAILTGMSRLINTGDRRAFGEDVPIALGGSKRMNTMREHFVIFVRPVIM